MKFEGGVQVLDYSKESDKIKQPVVTIITVVYNAAEELEKTIKNILSQDYKNIEHIIIDGGSTDNTVEVIKENQKKIDYWISEKDNGIYDAMNKGIELISGDWVNFMNAGDTFDNKNIVSKFVKKIKKESDICYGSRYIHQEGKITLEKTGEIDDFYLRMPFGHQAAFIKTELMKKHKYNLSYALSADYDFFIKCYKHNSVFQNLGFPICHFTVDGLSYKNRFKSLVETLKVLTDYTNEDTVKNSTFYKGFQNTIVCKDITQTIIQKNEVLSQKQKLINEKNTLLGLKEKRIQEIVKLVDKDGSFLLLSKMQEMLKTSIFTNPSKKYMIYKELKKLVIG
ncbi:MAG: glycosyltransferase [gamma proteobacterium symbiont of Bathyaustriella thionipta]|nr:glycosyltransferase [gamma proteobacterium symbiont of Bathyaustriella thionipta]MCU7957229.1 glycosyltransferase [gamma proteobacterium symbiont of Bathyaustriella thionipta]MCU7968050.1 glycosyltransferase [gamma proteobacterium symbiont of Bathyaustriella thionipta]